MRALGLYATLIFLSLNGLAQTQYEISGRVYLSTGAELLNGNSFRIRTSPGGYTYGFAPNPYSIFVPANTYQLDIEVIEFDLNGARACRLQQDIDDPVAVNGDTVKDLTLPEFLVISGRITDQDGNALASSTDSMGVLYGGATVKFEKNDGQGKCPVTVQTDENGDYKVALVASDNYTVTVTPPSGSGLETLTLSNQAVTSTQNDRDFTLTRWPEISGRVHLSTGAELLNGNSFRIRTSPGGYTYGFGPNPYSIFVPANTYQLDIEVIEFDLNGARACRLEQDIDNPFAVNGDTVKDLTLPEFLVVSGRITDQDSNAIASSPDDMGGLSGGATVKFEKSDNQGQCPVTVQTDENGDYKVALVASDNYTVTVTPPSGSGLETLTLSNQAVTGTQNDRDFTLTRWPEISGRVYLSTGVELPNQSQFRVRTSPGDYTYGFGPNPYSIFVPANTYQLDIEVIEFDLNGARACRLEQDIDDPVAVNGDTVKDLTLPEFLVISGRITDQDGNALASSTDSMGVLYGGATVKFEKNDGQGKCPVTAQTDENGDYKVALVASDNYTVTVTPSGSPGSGYTVFSEQAISSNSDTQSYAVFSALAISRQPSGAVSGEPLEQQPEIVIQNSLGQTFTSAEHTVVTAELTITQAPQTSRSESSTLISSPILSGITTISFVGGRALFTDLTISGGSIGQEIKLVFKTDGGLELESSSFYLEGEGVSSVGLPMWLIWSATRQN